MISSAVMPQLPSGLLTHLLPVSRVRHAHRALSHTLPHRSCPVATRCRTDASPERHTLPHGAFPERWRSLSSARARHHEVQGCWLAPAARFLSLLCPHGRERHTTKGEKKEKGEVFFVLKQCSFRALTRSTDGSVAHALQSWPCKIAVLTPPSPQIESYFF